MATSTKLQECKEYAGDCVVNSQKEYEHHISKLRDIMVNGKTDRSYTHTLWLYAVEAWEIKNNLPTQLVKLYEDIPEQQ